MDIAKWNKTSRNAYVGTLLYSLLGILATILAVILAVVLAASLFGKLEAGGVIVLILFIITELAVLFGYLIFFVAIKNFKNITEGEDKSAFNLLWIAVICTLVSTVLGFFVLSSVCSVLVKLLGIASAVLMIIGFAKLKSSATMAAFSAPAVAGFRQLFTAQILAIVAVVLGWIPFVGGIFSGILSILVFIFTILGWKKVATPVGDQSEAPKPFFENIKEVVVDSCKDGVASIQGMGK